MLPTMYEDDLISDFELSSQPTRTYRLHFGGKPSTGMLDGIEAMKQTIYLILNCERYRYEMFSWDYGSELEDLFGQPNDAKLQLQLRDAISDALLQDDRITAVSDFTFVRNGGSLTVEFHVDTTEGAVESAVNWWDGGWEVELS